MTSRSLKIALAVSVALNVFAAAAVGAVWVARDKIEHRVAEAHKPGRREPVWDVIERMDPAVRDQVKTQLRAAAMQARPDFDEARAARREAIALTGAETFDPVAVAALLERSRASEARGRSRLETGAVEYNQTWRGDNDQAAPTTISIVSGGASVLDRLGLPQGEVMQSESKLLTVATSARAGDQFTITPAGGGRAVTVTIDDKDTLDSLAKKITNASNRQLKVTVITDSKVNPPVQRLQIVAADNTEGAVISAGAAGKDALAALGLTPGFVGKTGDKSAKTYGLNLSNTLNLNDPASIKAAIDSLASAMTIVRSAYRSLGPQTSTNNTMTGKGSSTAYQQAQQASYQAALNRLLA